MLCSIEKGIVKRQLPFSIVKSCEDGAGSRFSISFKEHHDYELEATSLEDKHKVNLYCLYWLRACHYAEWCDEEGECNSSFLAGDSVFLSRWCSLWIRSFTGTYTKILRRVMKKNISSLKHRRAFAKASCCCTEAAWRHSDGWGTDVSSLL